MTHMKYYDDAADPEETDIAEFPPTFTISKRIEVDSIATEISVTTAEALTPERYREVMALIEESLVARAMNG